MYATLRSGPVGTGKSSTSNTNRGRAKPASPLKNSQLFSKFRANPLFSHHRSYWACTAFSKPVIAMVSWFTET